VFVDPKWEEYKSTALAETKDRDCQPLGGVRPNSTSGVIMPILSTDELGAEKMAGEGGTGGGGMPSRFVPVDSTEDMFEYSGPAADEVYRGEAREVAGRTEEVWDSSLGFD
jgi:hypothetical protein